MSLFGGLSDRLLVVSLLMFSAMRVGSLLSERADLEGILTSVDNSVEKPISLLI